MPTPLDPISRKDLSRGLITEGAVSSTVAPMNSVSESINFHFDTIGGAKLRKGTTVLGTTLGGDSLGLYEFRDSGSGTNNRLIYVNGTSSFYLSGGSWIAHRTGLTAASKARFTTFIDYVFMVNGADATVVWDGDTGTSFLTTGNAASAPIGKYIENFRSRVWIAGNSTYPDRLYYSSIPSSVTTPIITWDTSVTTGQWIDISPSDGENITGLHRTKTALLVFKNNHIYRVYSISQADPDPKIDVGTYSQESIVETKIGVFFHHPTGFYYYSEGGIQEISQPIIDIVEAITLTNYSKVCGWTDGNHVYWSIGDVTVNGISYTNLVVRYTISSQVWTHYSYPSQFLVSSNYNDGSSLFQVAGDDAGAVLKINTGLTDNGTQISYSLVHAWDNLDGLDATRKNLSKAMFFHSGGSGSSLSYQVNNDVTNDWTKSIGQLKTQDTGFLNMNTRGRSVRFRISGVSKGEPFNYEGYEILEGSRELVING